MNVKLIKLTKDYYNELSSMIDEMIMDQHENNTEPSPNAIFKNDYHNFDYYLSHLEHGPNEEGFVPDSVFFLLDIDRNRLIGAINIRHALNDYLLKEAGHIGDGIRPSERNKGYATEMIRLGLLECKKLGIKKVLITCHADNIASRRTIIKNGGVLENEIVDSNGKLMQRYWINLE